MLCLMISRQVFGVFFDEFMPSPVLLASIQIVFALNEGQGTALNYRYCLKIMTPIVAQCSGSISSASSTCFTFSFTPSSEREQWRDNKQSYLVH